MWQVHAMIARARIDEQLHEAQVRRLATRARERPPAHHRFHVPRIRRHARPTASRPA